MTNRQNEAPFAFEGLDRLFHERARLGIVTSLAGAGEGLAFSDLKRLCGLTDGNLNRHLSALEEAGLLESNKVEGHKRPRTVCALTELGRERFIAYLAALEDALRQGTRAAESYPDAGLSGRTT